MAVAEQEPPLRAGVRPNCKICGFIMNQSSLREKTRLANHCFLPPHRQTEKKFSYIGGTLFNGVLPEEINKIESTTHFQTRTGGLKNSYSTIVEVRNKLKKENWSILENILWKNKVGIMTLDAITIYGFLGSYLIAMCILYTSIQLDLYTNWMLN